MKKGFLWGILASALILCACEKTDTSSYMPGWKGFSYMPLTVIRGDSLTVTAVQAYQGHLIYHAKYSWNVKGDVFVGGTQQTEKWDTTFYKDVVYDKYPQNPSISFKVPENLATGSLNTITVKFTGEYDYSGQGGFIENGDIFSDPEYKGNIQHTQSTNLCGKSVGTVTITVPN